MLKKEKASKTRYCAWYVSVLTGAKDIRRSERRAHACLNSMENLHPGISMGSASASDEEKHSTSASSDSEEATNAPSAVIREKDEHNVSDIVNESMRLTKPECSSKAETSELNPRGYRVPLLPQPRGEP